jgi:hypothetical protein
MNVRAEFMMKKAWSIGKMSILELSRAHYFDSKLK